MASELEMTELEDAIDRHRDRIVALEAQLAETLAQIDRVLRIDELPMNIRISDAQDIIEAARRVREGAEP